MADFITTIDLNELMSSNNLFQATVLEGLQKRILIVNEEICDDLIENFIMHIIWWNQEDSKIAPEEREPIRIIFNSPGGDSIVGGAFLDIIENSITPIIGIGIGLVASAAYYIYLACHIRYSTPNTVFLQHDGYIGIQHTSKKAQDTMKFFEEMEKRNKEFVLRHTRMDADFYDDHSDQEFYMYPNYAKELGVTDYILGEDASFGEVFG